MDFIGERTIMGLTSESKGQTLLIGAACPNSMFKRICASP